METRLVGYADDVTVLNTAKHVERAQLRLRMVVRNSDRWMRDSQELKAGIIVLTKKHIQTIIQIHVEYLDIETKATASHLRVRIAK